MLEVERQGASWARALARIVGALQPPAVRVAAGETVMVTVTRNGRVERVAHLVAGDELRLTARGLTSLNVEYCTSEDS